MILGASLAGNRTTRKGSLLPTILSEVESDNKKLAHQVDDIKMNHIRKSGM